MVIVTFKEINVLAVIIVQNLRQNISECLRKMENLYLLKSTDKKGFLPLKLLFQMLLSHAKSSKSLSGENNFSKRNIKCLKKI
jgi:hypothetical protein